VREINFVVRKFEIPVRKINFAVRKVNNPHRDPKSLRKQTPPKEGYYG